MLSYAEALEIVWREGVRRSERCLVESLSLADSLGRTAAVDIYSLDNNPRFDNSAMDGFLVNAQVTSGAAAGSPVRLEVVGSVAAGEPYPVTKVAGASCLEIMTGAIIGSGPYDAVIRLEDVDALKNHQGELQAISVKSPVKQGANIRYLGEDIRRGDLLFQKGTRIAPEHLLALSTAGYAKLPVFAPIKAFVFSTGNEIVAYDSEHLEDYQIRNSTAPLLCAALQQYGVQVQFHGIVPDEPEQIRNTLQEALEQRPDLIISTGGVSVGKHDLVATMVEDCGARRLFHRAAVRPGRPILMAEFPARSPAGGSSAGGPLFFGLPGNPISVAAATRFFVRPFLRALHAQPREVPQHFSLNRAVAKPAGLTFFQRAVRDGEGVQVLSGQASFIVSSLIKAEGWIVGASEPAELAAGRKVEWYPLW